MGVCLGRNNKIPQANNLMGIYSHDCGACKSEIRVAARAGKGPLLGHRLLLYPHGAEGGRSSVGSFIRAPNIFMRAPPL